MNRRKFFGVAAVAPIAAKEAVSAATDTSFKGAVQAFGRGAFKFTPGVAMREMDVAHTMSYAEMVKQGIKLGIISEEQLRDSLREDMNNVRRKEDYLDSDLEAARSFSISAKKHMQRERILDTSVKNFLSDNQGSNMLRNQLSKAFTRQYAGEETDD